MKTIGTIFTILSFVPSFSFAFAAKALGDDELCNSLQDYHLEVDALSGRNQAWRGQNAQ
jgi:hypothetical protein